MPRISVYVDGYNLYHAIDDSGRQDLKWLDLRALAELIVSNVKGASVGDVYYFSAFATWRPDAYKRHRDYVTALKTRNIKIILGNFKKKPRYCKSCNAQWFAHEEKETDINIAIQLLEDSFDDRYDRALIISGDTDLASTIRKVRQRFPSKHITLVLPPRRQNAAALLNASTDHVSLSLPMLARCQLPDQVSTEGTVIHKPSKYR